MHNNAQELEKSLVTELRTHTPSLSNEFPLKNFTAFCSEFLDYSFADSVQRRQTVKSTTAITPASVRQSAVNVYPSGRRMHVNARWFADRYFETLQTKINVRLFDVVRGSYLCSPSCHRKIHFSSCLIVVGLHK